MLTLDIPVLDQMATSPNGPFGGDFSTYIVSICFLLSLIGWIVNVWERRHSPDGMFAWLGIACITMLVAASVPFWFPIVQAIFNYPAVLLGNSSNNFSMAVAINQFHQFWQGLANPPASGGFFQLTWHFFSLEASALFNLVLGLFTFALSIVASVIMIPLYILQQVFVIVGVVFLPVAITAFQVPALRGKAATFISAVASVLAWPLGFALVALCTNLAFSVPFQTGNGNDPTTYGQAPLDNTTTGQALQSASETASAAVAAPFRIIAAALIMIVGTPLVPVMSYHLFIGGGAGRIAYGASSLGESLAKGITRGIGRG